MGLQTNWAFSTWVGGTHTMLLRREIAHLPDAALAFLVAHETAHIVHYGRGEIHHDEAEADRCVASWGGVRVPVNERDGIPAWGEAMSEASDLPAVRPSLVRSNDATRDDHALQGIRRRVAGPTVH